MSGKSLLKELARYNVGTYADIIYRNALLYSDEMAFSCGSASVTFAECNRRINRLIHALQTMGINKGEVIGILSWNCIEYTDVYGAAMKGGFIASPYNARLKEDELDYLINYSEATILFVGPELVEIVERLRPRLTNVKHIIGFGTPSPDMIDYDELLEKNSDENPHFAAK